MRTRRLSAPTVVVGAQNSHVAFRGAVAPLPLSLLDPRWGDGLSAIEIPESHSEELRRRVSDPNLRHEMCKLMLAAVERGDAVGPHLDPNADAGTAWRHGFDHDECFVALHSTDHHGVPPGVDIANYERPIEKFYIVCRAGAGRAARDFHRMLSRAHADKLSFDALFGDDAHRSDQQLSATKMLGRVEVCGSHNRARILHDVASRIGVVSGLRDRVDHAAKLASELKPHIEMLAHTLRRGPPHKEVASTWMHCSGAQRHPDSDARTTMSVSSPFGGVILSRHADECLDRPVPFAPRRVKTNAAANDAMVQKFADRLKSLVDKKRLDLKRNQILANTSNSSNDIEKKVSEWTPNPHEFESIHPDWRFLGRIVWPGHDTCAPGVKPASMMGTHSPMRSIGPAGSRVDAHMSLHAAAVWGVHQGVEERARRAMDPHSSH